jgi:GPH family glycoside/pentoside/hexuronide:cation symporter
MKDDELELFHSKLNMVSYGCGSLSREFVSIAFNVIVFFYYEVEIGLNVWFIAIALTIFAIYNAINDPLLGFLTNRPFKFTKKWGRRMPWILIGGIPLGFSYFLIFIPPRYDPVADTWIIFGWLVFTTCLFDTFHSLFWVNFQSLFPDKFRNSEERRTATGIQIVLGIIGVALGSILPPLFYQYGNLESYIIQGVVVIIYALVTMILAIPGIREDQQMIDLYLESFDKDAERTPFIKTIRTAFKQKSFIGYVFLYTMYNASVSSMTASTPYVVFFILKMPSSAATLIMAGLLVGVLISIPLWVKLSHKINDNRKIMLIAAVLMGIYVTPLIFLESYLAIIIIIIIWGTAQGAYWLMIFPVFSEVIDESVVKTGKREEGTYTGLQQFFGRLGLIIQVMSFAIVHELTGFVEGADTQTPLAIWGIHMHLALIPMICILLGALVFWKLFDLRPEKIEENQRVIKLMKL